MSDPQHEPTMEEILASIRKIISEDGPETPAAAAPAPAAPIPAAAPAPVEEPDVLELTQVAALPPEPVPEPPRQDDIIFETVAPTPPAPMPAADHGDIFSDTTRKAMDDAFAAIPDEEPAPAPAPRPAAAPLAPVDGSTVEGVFERAVRESFEPVLRAHLAENSAAIIDGMKPLIREWMDEHFPPLLEGAVRAEVERVVRSRGTKR